MTCVRCPELLHVEVIDKDTLTTDDAIGSVILPLKPLVCTKEHDGVNVIQGWFPICAWVAFAASSTSHHRSLSSTPPLPLTSFALLLTPATHLWTQGVMGFCLRARSRGRVCALSWICFPPSLLGFMLWQRTPWMVSVVRFGYLCDWNSWGPPAQRPPLLFACSPRLACLGPCTRSSSSWGWWRSLWCVGVCA